ncbi:cytochrome P450 [Streptomyces sp. MNP-20]|uniref:cytochrome P450 n=1 Tax=Streptomyces sp. MNP-20 TaxID=2721165 RepID=UPI002814D533|nr:cytochrome P450 [Streptomyces sp. MNP-20]
MTTAPRSLPLLGHALPLLRTPLQFLAALPSYGDLVALRIGPERAYMACHPELVQHMLLNPRVFDKGGRLFDKVRPILGNGLVTSGWHEHRRQRPLVQPAFHRTRITAYTTAMEQETEALLTAWHPGRIFDAGEAMHTLTTRIAIRALLSRQGTDDAVAAIQRWLPVVLAGVYHRTVNPLTVLEKLPTPGNRRFQHGLDRLHGTVAQIIQERRNSPHHRQEDVLDSLLAVRDQDTGAALGDDEIHEQIMTLLVAGTETIGNALAWALHLLASHPQAERRLQEEADTPKQTDASQPSYAHRVFTETLRLYPPGWLFSRITTRATELGGHPLPAGATVMYSQYALHHNPALFPDPDRFDPDRWTPQQAGQVPGGAMIPFGSGNRKCIGDHYAMTLGTLALTAVAARWQLRPAPGSVVHPVAKATLGTGPLPMIATSRTQQGGHTR